MERRTEQRVVLQLPVQVWGNDEKGTPFSQDAIALNVSLSGALISNMEKRVRIGDLLGVRYKSSQAHFRVVWCRDNNDHRLRVAVHKLHSDPCPWEELLPAGETVRRSAAPTCNSTAPEPAESRATSDPCAACPNSTRRRWLRYNVDVPIRVVLHDKNKTTFVSGRGTAISQGGMAVNAGIEAEMGEVIEVEFTPPYSGTPIRIRGKVCSRSGYSYGIEFLRVSGEQADATERLRLVLASMSPELQTRDSAAPYFATKNEPREESER